MVVPPHIARSGVQRDDVKQLAGLGLIMLSRLYTTCWLRDIMSSFYAGAKICYITLDLFHGFDGGVVLHHFYLSAKQKM